jgi:hypothetical protein
MYMYSGCDPNLLFGYIKADPTELTNYKLRVQTILISMYVKMS